MGDNTPIEWTDATWNPVSGCSKVSQGCKHCYAERLFPRPYPGREFTDVRDHPERLEQPLRWRAPRRIFVNSMSDLFHDDVPDHFIAAVFAIMAVCPHHTFQVLTKRPERALRWFSWMHSHSRALMHECVKWAMGYQHPRRPAVNTEVWPLPNVWLGVSVEDQERADERIPILQGCPAAVRFLSCEPLLGPLNIAPWLEDNRTGPTLDWVIVGGESGPHARPMHPEWARWLRNQCVTARVPFFFKQWGEWGPEQTPPIRDSYRWPIELTEPEGGRWSYRVGKAAAGRLLDGATWNQFPKSHTPQTEQSCLVHS